MVAVDGEGGRPKCVESVLKGRIERRGKNVQVMVMEMVMMVRVKGDTGKWMEEVKNDAVRGGRHRDGKGEW